MIEGITLPNTYIGQTFHTTLIKEKDALETDKTHDCSSEVYFIETDIEPLSFCVTDSPILVFSSSSLSITETWTVDG